MYKCDNDCISNRHWHELGYLILYVTARPDMQQRMVVTWLAQHNFPHGMVAFMDGLSAEPIRQKTNFIRQLVTEVITDITISQLASSDLTELTVFVLKRMFTSVS